MQVSWQWLKKLKLVDPPIKDKNTHICSHYFKEDDFVKKPKLQGFEHKLELLDDVVPIVCTFSIPTKCRKFSETRASMAEHRVIVEELLPDSGRSKPKPSTTNTGVHSDEN